MCNFYYFEAKIKMTLVLVVKSTKQVGLKGLIIKYGGRGSCYPSGPHTFCLPLLTFLTPHGAESLREEIGAKAY